MLDRKIREELARELEIPKIVRERVKYTLDDVRLRGFGKEESQGRKNKTNIYRKGVAVAACIILASSITVAAAVTKWRPDFVERFQISEGLQAQLSNEGIVDMPLQTIEYDGISVSLEQCLTDNEFFCCLFKITIPEGGKGDFDCIEVEGYKKEDVVEYNIYSWKPEGEESVSGLEDSSYYCVISGEHNTLMDIDSEGNETADVMSFDNVVKGSCVTEEDYAAGYMTFRFKDFTQSGVDTQTIASGPWEFQWAEKKVEIKKEYIINQKVGKGYYAKSNAILKNIIISPIVVSTVFDIADRPEDKHNLYLYPAQATAVELKDGSKITLSQCGSGFENNLDDENNNFRYSFFLNTVIEPEEVTAIYFGDNERIELQ